MAFQNVDIDFFPQFAILGTGKIEAHIFLTDKAYMLQIVFDIVHGQGSHFHFLSSRTFLKLGQILCYQGCSSIIVGSL